MYVESKIREVIAESGKMTVPEVMAYFKARHHGRYNPVTVRANAKEMIKEAKAYM